jgi:REP element-mobilizing transposase RayT
MADPRAQRVLERFQIVNPDVDLRRPQTSPHAVYWYNLHVALVYEGRCPELREEVLQRSHDMILGVAGKKGHRLSRTGIVADHIHLALGCDSRWSPAEVALGFMNNLAYAQGMKRVFAFSYYVGTFGEYDRNVVPSG